MWSIIIIIISYSSNDINIYTTDCPFAVILPVEEAMGKLLHQQ